MKLFAKRTLCVFAAVLCCFALASCSAVTGLLEKVGGEDIKEKIDVAWSEVVKEKLDDLEDDAWREYGLGKSLGWPDEGNGSYIPKFREGDTESVYISADTKSGRIIMSGASASEYGDYIAKLEELGYNMSLAYSQLDAIYVFDGLYCGLKHDGGTLYICYGESVDMLNAAFDASSSTEQ